jgi:uncharacterized iron-regulated membrane protein
MNHSVSRNSRGFFLRHARRLRALHRWLGIVSAVFLLLLCVTGLALNHASRLGLSNRFLAPDWLLAAYGFRSPEFGPSYTADGHWITLVNGRLFLNGTEVSGVALESLAGAAALADELVAVSNDELVMLSRSGDVLERYRVDAMLPGAVERVALQQNSLLLFSAGETFAYDGAGLPATDSSGAEPEWVAPMELPVSLRANIELGYRGPGLSAERVLADLHSGRLFGLSGVVVMDVTAFALCVLAVSGLLLFFRRR